MMVTLAGALENVGASSSCIKMLCVPELEFPQSSVAVQILVKVIGQVVIIAGDSESVTSGLGSQLSDGRRTC